MKTVECLLKEVAFKIGTLQEARKRFSAQLAPDFNLFDYSRTDEMGVSKVIADLLDPKGAHGQGAVFLTAFAKLLEQEWITGTNDWRVVTEQQANGQRRMDVYLESANGDVIGIENKPWASDQPNQLKDYAEHLKIRAGNKNWLLIYLGNNEPTGNSITEQDLEKLERNFIHIDFHRLVDWLNDCAAQSRALVVRVFIEELAKFVRTNINGELEMSEEQEVIGEIRKSGGSIAAAFHVANAMTAFKRQLLQEFKVELENQLKEKEKGFHLAWNAEMSQGWKAWVDFGVTFDDQQDKYLCIAFERSGLNQAFWGIKRNNKDVKKDDEIWTGINKVMQQQFGHGKEYDWWPWCSDSPDSVFDKDYKNWGISEKPWIEMENGNLATKIVNLADQVFNLFRESNKIHLLQAKAD